MSSETTDELLKRTRNFVEDHLHSYLTSGGAQGHIMDMSHTGVDRVLPTLLLKTTGRRSGRELIVPLIYGYHGGEWVVVGSKGGAPDHPAWFLNLGDQQEVCFQIATQAFRGTWRLAEGEERQAVWSYMAGLFPPYDNYQQSTDGRVIPLVMLSAREEIPVFRQT